MSRRVPWRALALAAAAAAVWLAPGAAPLLRFDRTAILDGQLWRLLTGHAVHGTAYHLGWNLAALTGLGLLFERSLGRDWWPVLGFSCLTVGAGLLWLDPGLSSYVGLSGALNGIWVAGALAAARRESEPRLALLYRGCVIGALAKIAVEALLGRPLFTDGARLGAGAVPLAHALGCLAGVPWLARRQPRTGGRRAVRRRAVVAEAACTPRGA